MGASNSYVDLSPWLPMLRYVLMAVVALTVAATVSFIWKLRHNIRAQAERVSDWSAGRNVVLVDKMANFFGRQSLGMTQLRGNGCLVASDDDLLFVQLMPLRAFEIPRKDITAVETPSSFLAKSRFTPLLKLDFTTSDGQRDSAAWQVRDLDAWLKLLRH